MNVLVTGGAGMLGRAVVDHLKARHRVWYTVRNSPAEIAGAQPVRCDLTAPDLRLPAVDAVVHTAALTNVDYCQQHPALAHQQNVLATRNVAAVCGRAYMVYISTDFVFDGTKGNYTESDPANPISEYGRSKHQGEREVPANSCALRASIYGLLQSGERFSFIEKALAQLRSGRPVFGFSDQWFSPISMDNLAEIIAELIVERPRGVLHAGGPERLSKYDFFSRLTASLGYDPALVERNSAEGHAFIAPRPRDSSLDITKALSLLKTRFLGLEESFAAIKRELHNSGY